MRNLIARAALSAVVVPTALVVACVGSDPGAFSAPAPDGQAPVDSVPDGGGGADGDGPGPMSTITGLVIDELGRPRANVAVRIGSAATTTSGDGSFILSAAPRYDLEVVQSRGATGKIVTVVRGLSTRSPALQVPSTETAKVNHNVTVSIQGPQGGIVTQSERVTAVFVPKPTSGAGPAVRTINGGISVDSSVSWPGNSPNVGTVYALRYTVGPGGHFVTGIAGAGAAGYELVDSGPAKTIRITMDSATATGKLTGTITPGGNTLTTMFLHYRVAGTLASMSFSDSTFAGNAFDLLLPKLPDYSGALMVAGTTPSAGIARAWRVGLTPDTNGIALSLPPDFNALTPTPNATGIDSTTAFTWPAISAAGYVMQMNCPPISVQNPEPTYALTILTTNTTTTLPDTTGLGAPLPVGACDWRVGAASVPNADAFADAAGWKRFTIVDAATTDGTYVETAGRPLRMN
ncbi:MAG: hypothetical protein KF764_11855 [Labilithrix sp.]|nr:hypothetical protein [Labilithrix sp.]